MTHQYSITPRISETNLGGHIGAVVIPVWFEEARFAFIRQALQGAGFRHFLIHYEIDFKKEIFYGTIANIHTSVEKIGNRSLTFAQEVVQNAEICATGKSVVVHIDAETRKAISIPDETKEVFLAA
ncbi:MAG: acyl-CoA thioesterase [Desulfopila sp.]